MNEPKIEPLRILLVDDTPMNLAMATKMLSRKGHDVCAVESGQKALTALQEKTFDVVLMDMMMPDMDGLETTREIRKRESAKNPGDTLPIIAMTANDMESNKQECFVAGMDGFITKPLAIREIVPRIAKIIAEKKLKSR